MKIERVVVGTLKENCYILSINNEVVIIDPGSEIDILPERGEAERPAL